MMYLCYWTQSWVPNCYVTWELHLTWGYSFACLSAWVVYVGCQSALNLDIQFVGIVELILPSQLICSFYEQVKRDVRIKCPWKCKYLIED